MNREKVDVVFCNGKVITLDSEDRVCSAVAVGNGRILHVGFDEEIRRTAEPGTKVIDLAQKTMLPGFIDPHTHLGPATKSFHNYVDGRCPPNKTIDDILNKIREKVSITPDGEWIVVNASIMGDQKIREKRYPNKDELDSVAPYHPVVIFGTVHTRIVNTCALRKAQINKETPNPIGGRIHRNSLTGEATGVLSECRKLLPIPEYTFDQMRETLRQTIPEYWVKHGFTSVYSLSNALEIRAYQELFKDKALPVRIQTVLYDGENKLDLMESVLKLGLMQGFGNDWLKLGGIKFTLDGAFMGISASTYEPYHNDPNFPNYGILKFEDQNVFKEILLKVHNAGFQLLIHAFGDRAQDLALDGYEYVLNKNPRPHRHRIEHFGNILTNQKRISRAKKLEIIPVTSIQWLYSFGDFLETYLGPERAKQSFVLRSMLDAGLCVADCSDTFGAEPLATNPFF